MPSWRPPPSYRRLVPSERRKGRLSRTATAAGKRPAPSSTGGTSDTCGGCSSSHRRSCGPPPPPRRRGPSSSPRGSTGPGSRRSGRHARYPLLVSAISVQAPCKQNRRAVRVSRDQRSWRQDYPTASRPGRRALRGQASASLPSFHRTLPPGTLPRLSCPNSSGPDGRRKAPAPLLARRGIL